MSAKHKLNSAYFTGALVIGGLVGAVTGSWTVFIITVVICIATSIHAGEIRR